MDKKILIVDDERHICALLTQVLEDLVDEGAELLVAHDGASGLQLALQEKPVLVLLDVMLPHLDGYQVCEALKQSPALRDVYVIMLTAKGQAIDRRRGEDVNVDEYITKPFDPDLLLQKAEAVVRQECVGRAA